MRENNRLKKITIIVIIIFFTIIGISAYFIADNAKKTATVEIMVAPTSSDIYVGKQKFQNGTHKIEPGTYEVTVSKDGFETQTLTIEAQKDQQTEISLFLNPLDGNDWYETHDDDNLIRGTIQAAASDQKVQEFYNQNSIISSLPIKVEYYANNYSEYVKYTISYQLNDDITDLTLIITDYTGGNYERAAESLANRGYDIDDYSVEYVDKSDESSSGHAF